MPIPSDFKELITDFAREVLRCQPENIYEFGAQYFGALDEEGLAQHQQKTESLAPKVAAKDSLTPKTERSNVASEYVNDLMDRTASKHGATPIENTNEDEEVQDRQDDYYEEAGVTQKSDD